MRTTARVVLTCGSVVFASITLIDTAPLAGAVSECAIADAGLEPGTIVVTHALGFAPEETLERLTIQFESAHPGVNVELVNVGGEGGVLRSLRTDQILPDVVLANHETTINLSDSGLAVPMGSCIDAAGFPIDDLMPAALASSTVDGTVWSMPFMTSTPVVYFDRNQFRNAGVDPDTLPSDMGSLMERVEQVIDAGVVKRGFVTASTEWFVSIWAADLGLELAPLSGRTALGPTTFDLSDNRLIDRLDLLRSFAEGGAVEHVLGDDFNDLLLLTDPTAPVAMVAHSSGSMKTVYDTLDVAFPNAELGVQPFPDSSNGTVLGGPNAWLLSDTAQQQALGWAFISYIAGTEAQAIVGSVGYAPIRRSALDDQALLATWAERPGLRVPADVLWSIDPSPAAISWAAGPDLAINWRLAWAGRDIIDGRPAIDSLADARTDIVSALAAYRESRRQVDAP